MYIHNEKALVFVVLFSMFSTFSYLYVLLLFNSQSHGYKTEPIFLSAYVSVSGKGLCFRLSYLFLISEINLRNQLCHLFDDVKLFHLLIALFGYLYKVCKTINMCGY